MNLLELFKQSLLLQKKPASPITVKNYLSDVRHFISWLEEQFTSDFDPKLITSETLDLYNNAHRTIFSSSSLERHLSSLRKFFVFLTEKNIIDKNPFTKPVIAKPTDLWKIKEFKDLLYRENASAHTIKNYIKDIEGIRNWHAQALGVDIKDTPNTITLQLIQEYKTRLLYIAKLSPKTINRKLSAIRRYVEFTQNIINPQSIAIQNVAIKPAILEKEQTMPNSLESSPTAPVKKRSFFNFLNPSFIEDLIAHKIAQGIKSLQGKNNSKTNILSNIKKDFYAPDSLSIRNFPLHKKLYHHIRHTRPEWYKKYHNQSFAHYLNASLLIIYSAIIGLMLYQNLFEDKRPSFAAPNQTLKVYSFQGRLTDTSDEPITTSKLVRFILYTSPTASDSARLWEEVRTISPDSDGIFSILLGSNSTGGNASLCNGSSPSATPATSECGIPDNLFRDNSQVFLGISIEQDSELTPRQQIATVAYSTNSLFLQGLPPITQSDAGTTNVVLALDSSGDLTIGGSASPTFQASGGQFTFSGDILTLLSNADSGGDIQLIPDGMGKIDLQKPIVNTGIVGNLSPGGVEINDKFGILATESAVAAFVVNNNTTGGDIFTASSSGATQFTIANDGTTTIDGSVFPSTTSSVDLGSSALRWNNLYVNTISTTSISQSGQAVFTYDPATTAFSESTVFINPTTASTSDTLLGIGIAGVEKAGIDAEGDLVLGYSSSTAPLVDNPFNVYNHGTSLVASIDTSGNASFSGTLKLSTSPIIQSTANQTLTLGGDTTGDISFAPGNSTNALYLQTGGNIGIGTTAPDQILTIDDGSIGFSTGGGASDIILSRGAASRLDLASGDSLRIVAGQLQLDTADGGTSATGIVFGSTGDTNLYRSAADTLKTDDNFVFGGSSLTISDGSTVFTSSSTVADNKTISVSQTGATVGTDYAGYFTNTGAATTNVGLYSTATGATNNYAAIFEAGNVGIGTTAPSSALDVRLATTGTGDVINVGNVTNGRFGVLGVRTSDFAVTLKGASGNPVSLAANSAADHLYIATTGNVGIGTTSPQELLNVNGEVSIGAAQAGQANVNLHVFGDNAKAGSSETVAFFGSSDAAASNPLGVAVGHGGSDDYGYIQGTTIGLAAKNLILQKDGGNVGVGTTSPGGLGAGGSPVILHVNDSGATANDFALLNLSSANVGSGGTVGSLEFGTTGASSSEKRSAMIVSVLSAASGTNVSGNLSFYTNNAGSITEKLQITAAGQVQAPITGSSAGLLIGGDTQLYRGNTNEMYLASGDSLRIVSGALTLDSGLVDVTYTNGLAAFKTKITGDTDSRFYIESGGTMYWGAGVSGLDTNLYRSAADTLRTGDAFVADGTLSVAGGYGSSGFSVGATGNVSGDGTFTIGNATDGSRITAGGSTAAGIWVRYTDNNMYIDSDSNINFRANGASSLTSVGTLSTAGQIQLPITGSSAGILIGGDTQLYRGAANRLDLASGDSLNVVNGNILLPTNGSKVGVDSSANYLSFGQSAGMFDLNVSGQNVRINLDTDNDSTTTAFSIFTNAANGAGTELYKFNENGRLDITQTGSSAGLLIGGDTQLYRLTTNVLAVADGDTFQVLGGTLNAGADDSTSSVANLFAGATTGSTLRLYLAGDADSNFDYYSFITSPGDQTLYLNAGNSRAMSWTYTASVVNRLNVTGGAIGSGPVLSAAGSDTDIDLQFTPKGVGDSVFTAGMLEVSETGSGGGLLLGGDTQLYRGAADVLQIASGDTLDVATFLQVGANDRTKIWECAGGGGCFAIDNSSGTRTIQLRADGDVNYINGGNVGIGTASPQSILHVRAGASDSVLTGLALGNESTAGSVGVALDFRNHTSTTVNTARIIAQRTTSANSNSELQFWNFISGSLQEALTIDAAGQIQLPITGSSAGLLIGGDTQLYRSAANQLALATGDNLILTGSSSGDTLIQGQVTGDAATRFLLDTGGAMYWGDGSGSRDTNLYRSAANTLKTDDDFVVGGTTGLSLSGTGGQISFANGETIDNDTNGTIAVTADTLTVTSWAPTSTTRISAGNAYSGSSTAYAINGSMYQSGASNSNSVTGVSGDGHAYALGVGNTLTWARGIYGVAGHNGGTDAGTVTNAASLYAATIFANNGGVTTNGYGLYIEDQTAATNDYGIAIVGADTQALWIGSGADNTDAANGIAFGSSRDTNLYRSAANTLKTDDALVVGSTLSVGGDISSTNTQTSFDTVTKLSDPATLPAGESFGVAFSADGVYLVQGHSTSPYITIYKRSGDTFTKLADPADLPAGQGQGASFSPDGHYLAVVHATSPYITIYKRSGDTFTKLANPADLPNGSTATSASFSPDGVYLAITHINGRFLTIYKRSGDTFTKLADPGTLPPDNATGASFSPDGQYLAVGHNGSPYLSIYHRSGDTFTKLSNPADLPPAISNDTDFSPDGQYLAVAHSTSPYITIYKRSGDTFTKLANPASLPTGQGEGVSFSPDGQYLAVSHFTSPYITIYKRSGDTFTKLSNPADLPAGTGYGTSFSPDGQYLAVAHSTSPYITIYKADGAQANIGSAANYFNNVYATKFWGKNFSIANFDLAEEYYSTDTLVAGEIVSVYSGSDLGRSDRIERSASSYQQTILGVVSTKPGITLSDWEQQDKIDMYPIALAGRVPVKVSTENGPIQAGDAITSSSIPGVGMKATKTGKIIGRALTSYNGEGIGSVTVFVNTSWHDPDIYIASTGDLSIQLLASEIEPQYKVSNSLNETITRMGAFAELVVGNFRAGVINAQQIITGSVTASIATITTLSTDTLAVATTSVTIGGQNIQEFILATVREAGFLPIEEALVSPLASIDQINTNIISPLGSETIAVTGNIEIKNAQNETVAQIDTTGSATFSGQITSEEIQTTTATVSGTLAAENVETSTLTTTDATISGTLRAGRILADDIEGLNARIATLAANTITNYGTASAELISSIPQAQLDLGFVDISTFSASFGTFREGLIALGPSTFSQITAIDSLSVGTNLAITTNSINLLGEDLQIQPLRQGGISFLAGLVRIDTNGNLTVGGNADFAKNVTVHGNLAANIISPLPNQDVAISLENNGTVSNFKIQGASNSAVLAIDSTGDLVSSGSGTFNKLKLSFAEPAYALDTTTSVATGSAGTAILKSTKKEITINNPLVTEKSLIYVTPVGSATNQVLYLLRQVAETTTTAGSFTVGIAAPTLQDIQFNWIIVN